MPIIKNLVIALAYIFFGMIFAMEAEAMRPPLEPLSTQKLHEMITNADVIAIGPVTSVAHLKTLHPPLETIVTHIAIKPESILKGDKAISALEIEESYQQFSVKDMEHVPEGVAKKEKGVAVRKTGPLPPVGRYEEGARILVFLQSIPGSMRYRPVGSGSHDAYLGVLHITPEGVKSDRYRLDETVTKHALSENEFVRFILFLMRG